MCYTKCNMFRKILSVVTLILLAIVVWNARDEIVQAINFLGQTNIWIILLLIPEQLFMYFCCGQMFFSYMKAKKDVKKIPRWDLMRISFELNFVNHAVPSGGVSGLGYITWRLKPYGATTGQISFMYLLRYFITIAANQCQTIIAIIVLALCGSLSEGALWILAVVAATCIGIIVALVAIVLIASNKKRIDWFAKTATNVGNWFVKTITFGHKQKVLKLEAVEKYFTDIHLDLMEARKNRKILIKPIIWGIIYSFLEVATYWVVGASMGHPEILPAIMVAEAIGSVVGAVLVTPGGIGGYEGAMIMIMSLLGIEPGLATAVVVTTRIVVLIGTIATGYGFYQHAISTIGKAEKAEIKRINDENHYD